MIDKQMVLSAVESAIKDSDLFVVDVAVNPDKSISVEVDAPHSLDIDTCTRLTRRIEELLPAELDDYDLEVGSAGITAPFKVRGQWLKNVGNDIEMLTADGRKLTANLRSVGDNDVTVCYQVKEKEPGQKRPRMVDKEEVISLDNIRRACYLLKFK